MGGKRLWWLAAGLMLLGGVVGLPRVYRLAQARYDRLVFAQERLTRVTERNNLLLSGFVLAPAEKAVPSHPPELWFVGHIYPKNGFHSPTKPAYPDEEQPLAYLRAAAQRDAPARLVFGGDNVWSPSNEELTYVAQLKRDIPAARFVLGNHDRYWESIRDRNPNFAAVFPQRSGFEDYEGIRLVYLHTVMESGAYGLDQDQRALLAEALTGAGYRYALVFMHHALWAGETIYTNTTYQGGDTVAATWQSDIVPLLRKGRVAAVFAGDGGWRAPGRRFDINGIGHYLTGWSGGRVDILPEWLSVELGRDNITVTWNRLFDGEHYVRREPVR